MADQMTQEDAMNMSNARAIEILKAFHDMMFDQHGCPISDAVFAIEKAIEALSARPVVRGKWEINHYPVAECQVCKHLTDISCLTSINYCPNCGADMRGVDDGSKTL